MDQSCHRILYESAKWEWNIVYLSTFSSIRLICCYNYYWNGVSLQDVHVKKILYMAFSRNVLID